MLEKNLQRLEKKIHASAELSAENKQELTQLLSTLKTEVQQLNGKDIETIATLTEKAVIEATRDDKNQTELNNLVASLNETISTFEATHPKLVTITNSICIMLGNMGI